MPKINVSFVPLLAFLVATAFAQSAISIDEVQTTRFVTNYTSDAAIDWPAIASSLADANGFLETMVLQLSHLYGSSNNTNITSIAPCEVPLYTALMLNETAEMEVLCCHAKHLRRGTPLLKFADNFVGNIYGSNGFSITAKEATGFVASIGYLQIVERLCMQIKKCAQDSRIMVVENYSVRAKGLVDLLEDLTYYYSEMVTQLELAIACIDVDTAFSDCLSNATLPAQPLDPIYRNLDNDAQYAGVCSATALATFDQFRVAPSC